MRKKILIYDKNIIVGINNLRKLIIIKGLLGQLQFVLKGKDIIFDNNKVLLKSKVSFYTFLKFLISKIIGVLKGYYIELRLVGLGYRFLIFKNVLVLRLGFSHYIKILLIDQIKFIGYKNKLIIFGLDLQEICLIGFKIKSLKLPDIYKGKGIQYSNEIIKLKVGKKK